MEITSKQFKHCDLLAVKGRVDSATSPKLSEALDAILNEGRFKIVIDMAGLEYMSSAGFRALISAQRNCRRFNRGEVILAAVPANIYSASNWLVSRPCSKFFRISPRLLVPCSLCSQTSINGFLKNNSTFVPKDCNFLKSWFRNLHSTQ